MPAAPFENTKQGLAVDWYRTKRPINLHEDGRKLAVFCVSTRWLGWAISPEPKFQRFVDPVDPEATSRFRSFSGTAFHTFDAHICSPGTGVAISPSAKLGDKDEVNLMLHITTGDDV